MSYHLRDLKPPTGIPRFIVPLAAAAILAACGSATQAPAPASSAKPAASTSQGTAPASSAAASASGGNTQVTISIPAIDLSQFHVQVPDDQGFFKKHNLDVKLLKVSPPTAIAALQSGEVQFTTVTGSATRAAIQGLPVRVAAYTQIVSFSYVARSGINSLADLKGKKLGVTSQTGDDYRYTLAALKSVNLTVNDVQLLTIGSSEQVAEALIGGILDGGAMAAPFPQELHEKGFNVLSGPDLLELPSGGFAATTKLLQSNRSLVDATLAAIVDGIQWTKTHPDEASSYFAQKYSLSPEVAKEAYAVQTQAVRFDYSQDKLQGIIQQGLQDAKSDKQLGVGDVYDTAAFARYQELAKAAGLT